jgi:phage FluMu gp28-like protein
MSNDRQRAEALGRDNPEALARARAELRNRLLIPHSGGQEDILQSEARFRTLAAGRRWGKTKVAAHEIVRRARKPNQMIWWIANTYKNVSRGYREVVNQIPPSWLAKPAPAYTSTTKILQLKNGTMIEFYSGGSPDSLAGEGVDFVVVDEAALIPDNVWQQLIRPTLMDTGGEAFIISTPRGHNWFWQMWKLGQEGKPGYDSWRFAQTDNPYIPQAETAAAKDELPTIIFQQEIMAEFLASGASIFGLGLERDGAVIDEIVEPRGNVFVGIDLAKKQDFTVITADRESDGLPCYFERFQDIDWPTQQRRIAYAIEELESTPGVDGVTALIDSTGLGDVVHDNLIDAGVDVTPIDFNGGRKEQMARLLAADMEHGRARILSDMREEFESYEFTLTKSGRYQFEAVSGHDDMVAAKMLANWGRVHESGGNIEIVAIDPSAEAALRDVILAPTPAGAPDTPSDIMARPDAWDGREFLLHGSGGGFFGA